MCWKFKKRVVKISIYDDKEKTLQIIYKEVNNCGFDWIVGSMRLSWISERIVGKINNNAEDVQTYGKNEQNENINGCIYLGE